MALSVTRDELMQYCRVDDEDAGDLLENLADSAEEYLDSAGAPFDGAGYQDAKYILAVKALVLHWFDNPAGADVPASLQSLINQLKFSKIPK